MAGTVVVSPALHRSRGTCKINVAITVDASGNATATDLPEVFGNLVAVGYTPGTLATGVDITITDKTSGATVFSLTNAGTSPRYFRPTNDITTNVGVAVTDGANNPNTNRDIFLGGKLQIAVAQGGVSTSGALQLVVDESDQRVQVGQFG